MKQSIKGKPRDRESISRKLRESLGPEKVTEDDLVRNVYASDISPVPPRKPSLVVFPEKRKDVVAVLRTANEYKVPVTVMATGVNVAGACITEEGGIVIDLRRMNKIIEINTDS